MGPTSHATSSSRPPSSSSTPYTVRRLSSYTSPTLIRQRGSAAQPLLSQNGMRGVEHRDDGAYILPPPEPPNTVNEFSTHNTAEPAAAIPNVRTALLAYDKQDTFCEHTRCNHGTLSRPLEPSSCQPSIRSVPGSIQNGFGGSYAADALDDNLETSPRRDSSLWRFMNLRAWAVVKGDENMSTTQLLVKTHGVKNTRWVYLTYYFPFANWISQYSWHFLQGDLIAALTMASFYIPMALSYAANLGHLPPINGLYAFVINPFIYALLGSCPQMVVGPEAAGSLLLGNVVRSSISKGHAGEDMDEIHSRIAGVVTGMAGAIIFIAGLMRLGFLDSVLSRPFLRGFISAIGFVIIADQLIPEMGLVHVSNEAGVAHSSSFDKLVFLFSHAKQAHALTCWVSFGAFVIIMVFREWKRRLQPKYPSVAYVPDRFVIVVLSAVLTWACRWDKQGLEILGEVRSATGSSFSFQFPLIPSHMKHVQEALSTSFIIALLGFFESSVAAKSLGDSESKRSDGIKGMQHSANRELIALGTANMIGGCFMALPAFGGYGRSKVNASTGGRTPMSSILLSLITVICIVFLLPSFHYLPKGVLSAMVSVVAYSLIEECPHDIKFFLQIRGWYELGLMLVIFLATIFYSLPLGIGLGLLFSLTTVIKHATKPRIQILGREPGSNGRFENAEDHPHALEFVEGCLIIKMPEPLTFANTGQLKARLRRLERYGTNAAHPSLPAVRSDEHNKNLIFDIHGVTSIDGSGTQVLSDIVDEHVDAGVRVFFCRVPSKRNPTWRQLVLSGIVDKCGGEANFTPSVQEALDLAEKHDGHRAAPEDGLV